MDRLRKLYFVLAVIVAALAAAVIYIIVDKTAHCQNIDLPDNAAVSYDSDGGTVVCLPGYVFADGNATHRVTCSRPPRWNTDAVVNCIQATNPSTIKCSISPTANSTLGGDVVFYQEDPSSATQVDGLFKGLNSSAVQLIDVDNLASVCHVTEPMPSLSTDSTGLNISGTALKIDISTERLLMNETFRFYVRAIGSQRLIPSSSSTFDGVVVFIIEQDVQTVAVFSADSIVH